MSREVTSSIDMRGVRGWVSMTGMPVAVADEVVANFLAGDTRRKRDLPEVVQRAVAYAVRMKALGLG